MVTTSHRRGKGRGESRESRESLSPRPEVVVTTDEFLTNDAACRALTADPGLYQRGGLLVRVTHDDPAEKGIRRPALPRIEPVPNPALRDRLTAVAEFVIPRATGNVPTHPPAWCVSAVGARGRWPGVRRLEAVLEYPVLRPDGTVLCENGFDPDTGLLLQLNCEPPRVPNRPSRDDARDAAEALFEVVVDFPFAKDCHRSAWLAALLTPLARFAFEGPSPLFLADSNVRGSGKGLLLDCVSRIVSGERFVIAVYTDDTDELRKRITSLALAGDRLVLFDNLQGNFGNAVLDAALTGTIWRDRVLGFSRMMQSPLYATWYATGNNVAVGADTSRRCCHLRLDSPLEHPEERSEFVHPDLLGYVAANRARLLGAALVILRAYCAAGRPGPDLLPWGSFEGWSRLIRGAVVWLGLPDPGETRRLLQARSDLSAEAMGLLLRCWERMDPQRHGLTSSEVIDGLFKNPSPAAPPWHPEMRDAVEALCGKADGRSLGAKLRHFSRRVFGDRYIDRLGTAHHAVRWVVRLASEFLSSETDSPDSPDSPAESEVDSTSAGESGESGESVPPQENSENGDGNRPQPPPGATFFFQDIRGRPCGPGDAFQWCWSGGPGWLNAATYPPPTS
jgi:hypothetical protein